MRTSELALPSKVLYEVGEVSLKTKMHVYQNEGLGKQVFECSGGLIDTKVVLIATEGKVEFDFTDYAIKDYRRVFVRCNFGGSGFPLDVARSRFSGTMDIELDASDVIVERQNDGLKVTEILRTDGLSKPPVFKSCKRIHTLENLGVCYYEDFEIGGFIFSISDKLDILNIRKG